MGLRSALARVACRAPVPVFVAGGPATAAAVRVLRLRPELEVMDSPRHANALVVPGPVPVAIRPAVAACHDQLPHPRLTMAWLRPPADGREGTGTTFPPVGATVAGDTDALASAVVAAHIELLTGRRPTEEAMLPDEDSVEWRGVGPYGHGGKGMTGGTPYGRPLTGRAPDRDGLQLDQLPVSVGPYFAPLPPGLTVRVKLQGDVVQEVEVGPNPFTGGKVTRDTPFDRALRGPVAVAELELARARHHLRWLADAIRVQGLAALGRRVLALAEHLSPTDGPAAGDACHAIRRSGVLPWSLAGGRLAADSVSGRGLGPVARAAGVAADARSLDPAYRELGFEPLVGGAGDTRARWQQRLGEVLQALDLACRAGDRTTTAGVAVESPRGPIGSGAATASAHLLELVPDVMAGQEWGDAVAALVSLDLDMAEAASSVAESPA